LHLTSESIDGRNRCRACLEAGLASQVVVIDFLDDYEAARAFVISANLRRRHMRIHALALLVLGEFGYFSRRRYNDITTIYSFDKFRNAVIDDGCCALDTA
jgi:hypothetical protein